MQYFTCQAVPNISSVFNLTYNFIDNQGHRADSAGNCAWHTELHNDKPSLITYYKFYFLQTTNQLCIIITAGKDMTITVYKFNPAEVAVEWEQEENNIF